MIECDADVGKIIGKNMASDRARSCGYTDTIETLLTISAQIREADLPLYLFSLIVSIPAQTAFRRVRFLDRLRSFDSVARGSVRSTIYDYPWMP